ncbi:MAG: radical SAM protein [Desulfobacteraceae bacterium]|jgi:pyruvate formate lyase activating enzyme
MSKDVFIEIDGRRMRARAGISIKETLKKSGYKVSKYPEQGALFAPCEVGGCWSCAVEVNEELKPSCVTPVREGLRIGTEITENRSPRRILHGFTGHTVGGVGTPWWLKRDRGYIEVACFAAGCNLRCPQCQNWDITYDGKGKIWTPEEAAAVMTTTRRKFGVERMAISGGESTLNRKWLVQYVRALKRLNPDPNARIHVDTNGSILTKDYIDELVEAGVTDMGPDLKGYYPETFMRITGMEDKELAERYLHTAWEAARYLVERYRDKVFTGIGIPYNKALIPAQEVGLMGEKLREIDPEVQVCVLDYRPEFKRLDLDKPKYNEMVEIHRILKSKGLKTVICQTESGHLNPDFS